MELSDVLCENAVKVEGTNLVYRCEYDFKCGHQIHIFDGNFYCRVPLRPDKYKPRFPKAKEMV